MLGTPGATSVSLGEPDASMNLAAESMLVLSSRISLTIVARVSDRSSGSPSPSPAQVSQKKAVVGLEMRVDMATVGLAPFLATPRQWRCISHRQPWQRRKSTPIVSPITSASQKGHLESSPAASVNSSRSSTDIPTRSDRYPLTSRWNANTARERRPLRGKGKRWNEKGKRWVRIWSRIGQVSRIDHSQTDTFERLIGLCTHRGSDLTYF